MSRNNSEKIYQLPLLELTSRGWVAMMSLVTGT